MSEKVLFEGVVVGFEEDEKKFLISIQGSIDSESASFYLEVEKDIYDELAKLGVGRMVKGEAVIVSRNPLHLKLVKLHSF